MLLRMRLFLSGFGGSVVVTPGNALTNDLGASLTDDFGTILTS